MSRLVTDDFINRDPRALWNSAKVATLSEAAIPEKRYLQVGGADVLTVEEGCVLSIWGGGVFRTDQRSLTASNLDMGNTFEMGKDYYVYLCDPGGTNDEVYRISLNTTYPDGFGATSSRKIGGFHYGMCRSVDTALRPVGADAAVRSTGWEANVCAGIVPRSVWTLAHRPKCSPEGMVYLSNNTWIDICQSSDDGHGGLMSAWDAVPLTGAEGLNWYDFAERLSAVGKRHQTYEEFCMAAFGSPGGLADSNANAWTAATNTARSHTGQVANAVSSFGCRDCVGNLREWTGTAVTRSLPQVLTGSGTFGAMDGARIGKAYTNGNGHGATGAWGYDATSPFPDGYGNIYQYHDYSLVYLTCGGHWLDGVNAGARAVATGTYPWMVDVILGARGACEGL